MMIGRPPGAGASGDPTSSSSRSPGNLLTTSWFPIFTGTGLLLAILSIFMWDDAGFGVLVVVISALCVILSVAFHRRIVLYRGGVQEGSSFEVNEPRDLTTGRPD
jgi:hypothetical protein